MSTLRAATRGSALALWQTRHVAALLGQPIDEVVVSTVGDRDTTVPIHTMGGKGVFVKEVQAAHPIFLQTFSDDELEYGAYPEKLSDKVFSSFPIS